MSGSSSTVVARQPAGRPSMRMTWRNLAFFHWPVDLQCIRALVPPALDVDTFDGRAWIGLVPFTMRDVGHTIWPWIPTMRHFHECNVRTYVSCGSVRGVYFFSLDATSRLAVWGARTFWHLNYKRSAIEISRRDDEVRYAVDRMDQPRAALRCVWRAGRPMPRSQPGELAHFLTERYSLLTVNRAGRPLQGRIHHHPWPLRQGEVIDLNDSLVSAAGINVASAGPPLVYHADEIRIEAWGLQPCSTSELTPRAGATLSNRPAD